MTLKPARNKNQIQRQNLKHLSSPTPFEASYPNITAWVSDGGWIEIEDKIQTGSFVRALDEGGMIWEGTERYKSGIWQQRGLTIASTGVREANFLTFHQCPARSVTRGVRRPRILLSTED